MILTLFFLILLPIIGATYVGGPVGVIGWVTYSIMEDYSKMEEQR